MKLSPAELSYLKESLASKPPTRPDSRLVSQFRPLEATTTFLPTANGSARVRTADGAECIVGIKGKVVKTAEEPNLVEVDVDVAGMRDDHPTPNMLSSTFVTAFARDLAPRLTLTSRFSFKLFIDCVVISNTSHPLNLLSLTIYLALRSTKLPQIVSSTDDSKAEEIPVFNDDWDQAEQLCAEGYRPPVIFLMAVVGDNVLVDPTQEEEAVSEGGLFIGWKENAVVAPLRMVDLGAGLSRTNGISPGVLSSAYKLVGECGPDVVQALDAILEADKDHNELTTALF